MKVKLLIVISILSMLLCACSVEGNEQANYDIQTMLEKAEAQDADLEKKII